MHRCLEQFLAKNISKIDCLIREILFIRMLKPELNLHTHPNRPIEKCLFSHLISMLIFSSSLLKCSLSRTYFLLIMASVMILRSVEY